MEGRVQEVALVREGGRIAAHATKRVLDVAFAVLALILLSPFLTVIAIAIKLDTRGPVLFRQPRIGRRGEQFGMFKYRTMVDGADEEKENLRHLNGAAEGLFKIHGDPRVTRVGTLLRSTSLDELPQLLNVLNGEMSIVGPRPLIAEEDALIRGQYRVRSEMRPGMTGPWQVAGASKVPIDEMARLDHDYVESWSAWGDMKLIVRTVPHVVMRRGV